jgi:hypothetical protein
MRTSKLSACAAVLILGVFSGACSSSDETAAAAAAGDVGDGIHEYRAVCVEKARHGGNEYVLSKWFETSGQAKALGDYHGNFKAKGHQIKIEERVKPKKDTPATSRYERISRRA